MQEMFGVPIGTLAIVLIALVGLGIGILATLAIRNVVFFRLGMRNAARRRGRSVLIVVGLMLATTIIASALGTGDTMGRTIRSSVLRTLGRSAESRDGSSGAAHPPPPTPSSASAGGAR